MIGCIVVGGLVALGIAKVARHHARRSWCGGGHMRGGFGEGHGGGWGWDPPPHPGSADPWPDDDGDGWGHGGRQGWFRHGGHRHHGFGLGRGAGFVLRNVLSRLETTPTQNQALRAAVKDFEASAKAAKGEGRRTRGDVAAALRRPAIDAEAMGEMFARHDSALDGMRKAFVGLAIKVHDTLDETQRERLAQLLEMGPRWFRAPMAGMSPGHW